MFPKGGDGIIRCTPSKIRAVHLSLMTLVTMYLALLHFILFYVLPWTMHPLYFFPPPHFTSLCRLCPSAFITKNLKKEPIKGQQLSWVPHFLCSLHVLYVPFVFMLFYVLLNHISTAILTFSPAITLFCHWFALQIFPLTL